MKAQSELQANQFIAIQQQVKARFPNVYALEFTDGDLKRIQQLLNELRDHISQSKDFGEGYKQRPFTEA